MTEAERKARFWVARKASEAMKRGPDDDEEAKYLDDDTSRAIADLRKALFLESGGMKTPSAARSPNSA